MQMYLPRRRFFDQNLMSRRIKNKNIVLYLYLRKHRKIGLTYIYIYAFSVTVLWLLKIFTGRNIKIAKYPSLTPRE